MRGIDFAGCPFEQDSRWTLRYDVDIDKMHEATKVYLGTHDYSTFRSSSDDVWNYTNYDMYH